MERKLSAIDRCILKIKLGSIIVLRIVLKIGLEIILRILLLSKMAVGVIGNVKIASNNSGEQAERNIAFVPVNAL